MTALPAWNPPNGPLLVIAPHPDDETLGAGGLIASQSTHTDIVVAAVTDGESAYPDTPGLADLRRMEQEAALTRLGVATEKIVRFHLPDSGVDTVEHDLVEQLSELVSDRTHIVAPWRGDFHPDHEACGRAAETVARRTGAVLTSYFFWTWHRGTPASLRNLKLRSFPLNQAMLLAKTEALLCHQSQLEHASGEPILPERLLHPARRAFEVFIVA